MSEPEVEYLGWSRPAPESVTERLLKYAEDEPDAYRRAVVVVPTAESGRRLRERMAERAGKAILIPRTKLVGQLINSADKETASEIETMAAWMEILTAEDVPEDCLEFFPRPEHEQQLPTWAIATANRLIQLRTQLEQEELSIRELLRRLNERVGIPADFSERWDAVENDETRRWKTIQELFNRVDKKLEMRGREPAWKTRKRFIDRAEEQTSSRLILACVPDISAQVRHYLRNYGGGVKVWINAPEELKDVGFDEFGGVKTEYWAERPLPDGLREGKNIIVTNSAQKLAEAAVLEVGKSNLSSDEVVLGACDASFIPALVTKFARYGWRVNVPEGRAFRTTDLSVLPELLTGVCCAEGELSLSLTEPVLRNIAVQRLAGGAKFDTYRFGLLLDKLLTRYIPKTFHHLMELLDTERELPGKKREVRDIDGLRKPEFFAAATWLHRFILRSRQDIPGCLRELGERLRSVYLTGELAQAASIMSQQTEQLALFFRQNPCPPIQAWALVQLALSQQNTIKTERDRWGTHLDALGWRELTYTDGKLVLLTGMHEHSVPETLPADPFLPDSLRDALGLPCSRAREARDCFLLTALMSRQPSDLRIILSQSSADGTGTPVGPSPLLYHCTEDELTERVKYLFKDLPADETRFYSREWTLDTEGGKPSADGTESVNEQLAPHWDNPFARPGYSFSPSEITSFLKCPLRFWLKQALKLSPGDIYREDKIEASPAEYGTLLHDVLEYVGREFGEQAKLLPLEVMVRDAEKKTWEMARAQYGHRLPPMVKIQLRRFCSRGLKKFLQWHRDEILAGWVCYACEKKVDWELELPEGAPVSVSMRIDRIDFHRGSNKWRIIDYKTHARVPEKDHLEKVPQPDVFTKLMGATEFPSEVEGKDGAEVLFRWVDAQLPMYAYWLMNNPPEGTPEKPMPVPDVGYFNLPRSGNEDKIGYHEWKLLDAAKIERAMTCVRNAVILMREGKCLYSAEMFGCKVHDNLSETGYYENPRQLFRTLRANAFIQTELDVECE